MHYQTCRLLYVVKLLLFSVIGLEMFFFFLASLISDQLLLSPGLFSGEHLSDWENYS